MAAVRSGIFVIHPAVKGGVIHTDRHERYSSTIESYIANDQTLLGLDQSRQFVVYVAAYGVADAVFL